MIRPCQGNEVETICAVINDAARAYHGVIPPDRWKEPYMPQSELLLEVAHGVRFWGYHAGTALVGVMGIQDVRDVVLIRHAYVRTAMRRTGIGSRLLEHVRRQSDRPYLVGTWSAARWAIQFYQKHGFTLLPAAEKDRLLRTYWSIPERQIETSVVLADRRWFAPT